MIELSALRFLKELAKNNDREWFQANKKRFDAAQDNIIAFTGQMIGEIGKFDEAVADVDPKTCVFRIYRDTRFAKDKSPYKTNLGAYLAPGGRKSMQPGYYFHIEPGKSFTAAGKHHPDSAELLKIRNHIAANTKEFLKIVEGKAFIERFGRLFGESLSKPPKGFDAEHPAIEYLKLKTFTAYREYTDDNVVSNPEYTNLLVKDARAMYPFVMFLRNALQL
jgi:uncharacterized protein (TIGR02453 family)